MRCLEVLWLIHRFHSYSSISSRKRRGQYWWPLRHGGRRNNAVSTRRS